MPYYLAEDPAGESAAQEGVWSDLARYPWPRFEPHPEWVEPHWTSEDYTLPYAAGIPDGVRLFYFWGGHQARRWRGRAYTLCGLPPGATYRTRFINPDTFAELPPISIAASTSGSVSAPRPPSFRDWLLVIEPAP
jgi:hypothetical protein